MDLPRFNIAVLVQDTRGQRHNQFQVSAQDVDLFLVPDDGAAPSDMECDCSKQELATLRVGCSLSHGYLMLRATADGKFSAGFHGEAELRSVSANEAPRTLGRELTPIDLPLRLHLDGAWIEVTEASGLQSPAPCDDVLSDRGMHAAEPLRAAAFPSPAPTTLAAWFEALGELQRIPAATGDFLQFAAEAMVRPGGLDAGMVLLPSESGWQIAASCVPTPPAGLQFDTDAVSVAVQRRRTLYSVGAHDRRSHAGACVALCVAPVVADDDRVIAVLYGARDLRTANQRMRIRDLEAMWLQLLADAVASGLQRLNDEQVRLRHQLLLEQAFPPTIVRQLVEHPDHSLPAQERVVTVMFADIIDSTSFTEGLDADTCFHLLSDVLDMMTHVIQAHDGVVVDYFGDGLIAMWNAPLEQSSHARLCCETALSILAQNEVVNEQWKSILKQPMRLGIGVNTGPALVGNSGSRFRLKYGPRGATVNMANRVEKATRQLGVPILITEQTAEQLDDSCSVVRMGRFRVRGFAGPVALFALQSCGRHPTGPSVEQRLDDYEELLSMVENHDYDGAFEHAQRRAKSPATPVSFLSDYIQHPEYLGNDDSDGTYFDLTKAVSI